MNFANDSMQTSLCLQFSPQKIATACVYLAGQFSNVRPTQDKTWLEILQPIDAESLACISLQIIELVADRKGSDTEVFDRVRKQLDEFKDEKEPDAKRQRVT